MTEARLAYGGGDGATFGLLEDQSVESLIPDCIEPGQRVNAFTLCRVVDDYSVLAAQALDDALKPCPLCGLAFYPGKGEWGLCDVCDGGGSDATLRTVTIDEVALEQAGAFSPRCD